jgi:alkylation response protein AidB-like acyl-CoA dehydrogenase
LHFELSSVEEQIRDSTQRLARELIAPLAPKLDLGGSREEFYRNLKTLAEHGLMGLNVATDYGGVAAGTVSLALVIEEIAYACAATAVTVSGNNMVCEIIQLIGTEGQKGHYLPRMTSGEFRAGAFCLTESDAGSDPASMKTRARKHGDDFIINGEKIYITSGEYADFFVVWAVTDPEARKGRGITCFLVDRGTPGLHIGRAETKMGQIGSATNVIRFENCSVGAKTVLGKVDKGFKIAAGELAGGRIGIAALALGVGRAALHVAKDYVQARKQGAIRLSDHQGLRWMIADAETHLEAARWLIFSAASRKDRGLGYQKEASMAKLFASEAAHLATDTALQLHGGAGYIKGSLVERLARDVRVTRLYEGTSEIQRNIIAREVMGPISR